MSRTVSTFVPIEGIDVVVLSNGGTEVRVDREAPFSTDDSRLTAKLAAHRNIELVGEEIVEGASDEELEDAIARGRELEAERDEQAADTDENEPAEEV